MLIYVKKSMSYRLVVFRERPSSDLKELFIQPQCRMICTTIRAAKRTAKKKWILPHSWRVIDQRSLISSPTSPAPRPPRNIRPRPPVPGGRMYFIIKPVKARPSRFKKATNSTIKFSVVRFIIHLIEHNEPEKYSRLKSRYLRSKRAFSHSFYYMESKSYIKNGCFAPSIRYKKAQREIRCLLIVFSVFCNNHLSIINNQLAGDKI